MKTDPPPRWTPAWYEWDCQRMEQERRARGEPPFVAELERIRAQVDPETAAVLNGEVSELSESRTRTSLNSHNSPAVPVLDRQRTLIGLAGRYVQTLEAHTEADAAGLLVDFLVAFGNLVGSGPHMVADGADHPARLFALFVDDLTVAVEHRHRHDRLKRSAITESLQIEPQRRPPNGDGPSPRT